MRKLAFRGEFAENGERKDFTPGEAYDIWQAVKPLEEAKAKKLAAFADILPALTFSARS